MKISKIAALSVSMLVFGAGAIQIASAADEHGRPEPNREQRERPENRAPSQNRPGQFRGPGRPGFDSRGQVLDSRYNHGRYYPPFGTSRPSLPEGYRPYYRGRDRFYFSGVSHTRRVVQGSSSCGRPSGLVISVLPPFLHRVWRRAVLLCGQRVLHLAAGSKRLRRGRSAGKWTRPHRRRTPRNGT